jgi:branched-chain amino acid transport system ATP-binding protein
MVLSVFETLPLLRRQGVSVLLAEQNLSLGLAATDRAYVIHHGRIVLSGPASELAGDSRIVDTCLGR